MRGGGRLTVLALISVLALGACGDDDEDEEGAPPGGVTTTNVTTPLSPQLEAFCADVVRVQTEEPDIPPDLPEEEQMRRQQEFFQEQFLPLVRKIQGEAPPAAKGPIDEISRFFEQKGPAAFDDDALPPIEARANQAAATACGAPESGVTGSEYAYQGMPRTLPAGRRLFQFDNTGTELHEMVFLRKKPTTTESFDQLLALPEAEGRQKADFAGGLFAPPGGNDTALLDLTPGQYAIVCFIPVGFTPDVAERAEESGQFPEDPPHFTRGMKSEFTVS